jgi:hypothetical protein
MLAYLDALIAAVTARDVEDIARLLAHPLARVLTREARAEASAYAAGTATGTPIRLLQLQHQTVQLLVGRTDAEDPLEYRKQAPAPLRNEVTRGRERQMELPLSA